MVTKIKNSTLIYNEGYIAGYNQAKVDFGHMTQEQADIILSKLNKCKVS